MKTLGIIVSEQRKEISKQKRLWKKNQTSVLPRWSSKVCLCTGYLFKESRGERKIFVERSLIVPRWILAHGKYAMNQEAIPRPFYPPFNQKRWCNGSSDVAFLWRNLILGISNWEDSIPKTWLVKE